jgi:hypothetical protein
LKPSLPTAHLDSQTVRLDGTTTTASSAAAPPPPLPAMRLLWLSEDAIVTAGHSPVPDLYIRDGSGGAWRYLGACEVAPARSHAPAASASSFDSAKAVFAGRGGGGGGDANRSASRRGSDAGRLQHEGAVTYMQAVATAPAAAAAGGDEVAAAVVVTAFSTSGVDGRVLVWPLSALQLPAEAAAALAKATAH